MCESATRRGRKKANALDFDDLLEKTVTLLKSHAAIAEHYQRQFQFILVDEYQDTNHLQNDFIEMLAARHHNVMVVGDDAQSIYSWRGADFRNILEFPKRHAGAKIYKIETNYRSVPEVLELANAVIAPNEHQFEKHLVRRAREQRDEAGARAAGGFAAAGAIRRAADARIARGGRGAGGDGGAVPRAFSFDGIANGTDTARNSVRDHKRTAVLRAGPY